MLPIKYVRGVSKAEFLSALAIVTRPGSTAAIFLSNELSFSKYITVDIKNV
jgi:hypothetical protein